MLSKFTPDEIMLQSLEYDILETSYGGLESCTNSTSCGTSIAKLRCLDVWPWNFKNNMSSWKSVGDPAFGCFR